MRANVPRDAVARKLSLRAGVGALQKMVVKTL